MKTSKGIEMEERLRAYFLELGYFVVRGAKFSFQSFDVTDIDLWLYMRPSSVTRERINVDAKNKKTPQAIERIFWAKGLQQTLGFERCIVATTDKRKAVSDFGKLHDVSILDGDFYNRLKGRYKGSQTRFTEEEFLGLSDDDGLGKMRGNWKGLIEQSKTHLLTQLTYSGCNYWLTNIAYFFEQTLVDTKRKQVACRYVYLVTAYFLIGVDYVLKDLAFHDKDSKAASLRNGFTQGDLGTTHIIDTAAALVSSYLPSGQQLANTLRTNIADAFKQVPADILTEYFNQPSTARNLFESAKHFEQLAYQVEFTKPIDLDTQQKGAIGVLLDFCEISRRTFFDNFSSSATVTIQPQRQVQ